MAKLKVSYDTLNRFCIDAFMKFGFTEHESIIITDVLQTSDLYGIESHGVQRLTRYHKGIAKGMIKVDAKPEIVFETPVSAVIDGHDGMGQLVGYKGMSVAIEKAQKSGMAIVTVRNSNHYGIAGYYAMMACENDLIGLSGTNSEAIMVPTNARLAMLGSNPLAIAVPADPYPFLFDAATTVVTRGKLEMYRKAEKPLPDGWAVDEKGHPTSDAERVLVNIQKKNGGGILPLGRDSEITGGHKGYGYGMIVELLCSILSHGMTSNYVNQGNKSGTCHFFIAIDPACFGDPDEISNYLSKFLQELRDAPIAEGRERIYTHGEKEALASQRIMKEGCPVDIKTLQEMKQMSDYLKMDFESYFGKIEFADENYTSLY